MKALVYEGPRRMILKDVPEPVLTEGDVLIEVAYSGICGSELSGYLGQNSLRKPPQIFGHEFSGKIVDIGERVSKERRLQTGQRVTANPLISCGACRDCLGGRQQLCASRQLIGAASPGSNATLVSVPASAVYTLPDHVNIEAGAMVEPIACGVRAVELAQPHPSDTVLVMGMGPIGYFILQVLKVHGVRNMIAVDLNAGRLEIAKSLGATTLNPQHDDIYKKIQELTDGRGVAVAVDAVGNQTVRQQCIEYVSAGGRVVWIGLHEPESTLPVNTMIRQEISSVGSFAYSANNFQTALDWLADGYVGLDNWIVKAPFEEGDYWYDRLLGDAGKVMKVLLHPSLTQ